MSKQSKVPRGRPIRSNPNSSDRFNPYKRKDESSVIPDKISILI